MNSKLYIVLLIALCIYGLKELNSKKLNMKHRKVYRFIYISIITLAIVYFLGYEFGVFIVHLNN